MQLTSHLCNLITIACGWWSNNTFKERYSDLRVSSRRQPVQQARGGLQQNLARLEHHEILLYSYLVDWLKKWATILSYSSVDTGK